MSGTPHASAVSERRRDLDDRGRELLSDNEHVAQPRTQRASSFPGYRVAAIIPCHNEEAAIEKVIQDLQATIRNVEIYVFDNCSTDATAEIASRAGATVRTENRKGKGNVIRRAFADVDADVYLLIDGDDTYDATAAPQLIEALISGPYDHVLGVREPEAGVVEAYRPAHEFGNRLMNRIVAGIFGENVGDMLSGYRVFSRRFVKSFPAVSREFEIETELTVHCLALRLPTTAVKVGFRDRPAGSESKLRTYRDGTRILRLILSLARHERPVAFYGLFAAIFFAASVGLSIPLFIEWAHTSLVPRFPTLLVTLACLSFSVLALTLGAVLEGIRKTRHEGSRLAYLNHPAPQENPELLLRLTANGTGSGQPSAIHRSFGSAPRGHVES